MVGLLQWRAGQLSGQAGTRTAALPTSTTASMEGRTIVRPGTPLRNCRRTANACFNGGPDNCPARPGKKQGSKPKPRRASMEGRTIVRPGLYEAVAAARAPIASMEGRTIVRPGNRIGAVWANDGSASMEGRTIVRPGSERPNRKPIPCNELQWRAGQLSGQAGTDPGLLAEIDALQWRAGQLSGQAGRSTETSTVRESGFNGGPDNCPARLLSPSAISSLIVRLQWRAGQLSGQARGQGPRRGSQPGASMEGRTIVRPGTHV